MVTLGATEWDKWELYTIHVAFSINWKLVQNKKVFLKLYIRLDSNLAYVINVLLKMAENVLTWRQQVLIRSVKFLLIIQFHMQNPCPK